MDNELIKGALSGLYQQAAHLVVTTHKPGDRAVICERTKRLSDLINNLSQESAAETATEVAAQMVSQDRYLTVNAIEAQLNFLLGEIATLAEASFSDKEQGKAFKDLTAQFFTARLRWISNISRDPNATGSQNPYVDCK